MFGDLEVVEWERTEAVLRTGDERLDPILGPCPVLAGIEQCHEQLRWARVQARWKAKGWFWFVDWSSGPEARSFARVANIDHADVQPVTLEQLLDLWKKYAVEDD